MHDCSEHGPCNPYKWGCGLVPFEAMTATLHVDCTANQTPTVSASLPFRVTTAATDPPFTLNFGGFGINLFGGAGSANCGADSSTTLSPVTTSIAPGTSQSINFSVESHGGMCATQLCNLCGGTGEAQAIFDVVQADPRYPTDMSIPVGVPFGGTPVKVTCVGR
jgi:hypothetical protein